MKKPILKKALLNALATILYIVLISSLLFYGPNFFGSIANDTVVLPIIMLCLLVFSAAVTGTLIFGQPIIWYLDGRKKEAFSLLAYTLGIFLAVIALTFIALFIVQLRG
ncbi:MAG: hypothetical protein WC519_01725 [Parcubacteria group bacterium]